MLIRHLAYFVTLARERHFARAAELCNVAQPTLSAAIHKLEDDLGVQLIIRSNRFAGLTSEGEMALAWGRQILKDYDNLRDELGILQRGLTGTLRLGVIPAAMPVVSLLSARFSSRHPSATIAIQSMSSRAIQRALDEFEIDAGMTYLENEKPEQVASIPLYREHYVFVTQKKNIGGDRGTMTWHEAAHYRLCLLSDDMQNRRIIDKLAASINVTIRPDIVANSFLGIFSHLSHGEWSSIVPHTLFYAIGRAPNLVAIDLVEPAHSEAIGLVLSNREPRSLIADALRTAVEDTNFEGALTATSYEAEPAHSN
jgi:DNA-binding transcriptional LysR family regulator